MNPFLVLVISIGLFLWCAYVLYWAFWPDMPRIDPDEHDLTPAIRFRRRRP